MMSCLSGCYSCFCCEFNFAIFPTTKPTYNQDLVSLYKKINLCEFRNRDGYNVPYLEMKANDQKECIMYFHAKSEDIGDSLNFLMPIQEETDMNIFVMEYPTYGTYTDAYSHRISDRIKMDCEDFVQFLSDNKFIDSEEDIIIFGRQLGSGPASHLASKLKSNILIFISPFSTIPEIAKDFMCCGAWIVKEHFNNLDAISNFKGRLLVIHGQKDQVINYRHGIEVFNKFKFLTGEDRCQMVSPGNMGHNYFDMKTDIVRPIGKFIKKIS